MSEYQTPTVTVIKVGGAVLSNPAALNRLLSVLHASALPFVLVHGGGQMTDEMLAQAGFKTEKRDGQRITPTDQMRVVTGALAGVANKSLVVQAQTVGFVAVGLSLADGPLVSLEHNASLGCVGEPSVHGKLESGRMVLAALLRAKALPIISSIGVTEDGILCNVNADLAAAAVADLLEAPLILLSDVPAILDAQGHPVGSLTIPEAEVLLEQDFVQGGMRVKLAAAIHAAQRARRTTAIAGWADPDTVIALLHGHAGGTQIYPA